MHQVPSESLWVGNAGDVRDMRAVINAGICALVDVAADEPMPTLPRDLIYCRFPLVDGEGSGPGVIRAALTTTVELLRLHTRMLLYCSAGISRAPAIAAGAIAVLHHRPARDCLKQLATTIPHDVSPGLWYEVETVVEAMIGSP